MDKIFVLYGDHPVVAAAFDTARGADDYRKLFIVQYADGRKLAVKVTGNSFTTPERVIGWAELTEHYNALGLYCPRIVTAIAGDMLGGLSRICGRVRHVLIGKSA